MIKNIDKNNESWFVEPMPRWLTVYAPFILFFILGVVCLFIIILQQDPNIVVDITIKSNSKGEKITNNSIVLDSLLVGNGTRITVNDTIAIANHITKKYITTPISGYLITDIDSKGNIELYTIPEDISFSVFGCVDNRNQQYISRNQQVLITLPNGLIERGTISSQLYHSSLSNKIFFKIKASNIDYNWGIHASINCKGIIRIEQKTFISKLLSFRYFKNDN